MKELSIEGKATRYDQAIKVAKSKIKNDKDHVLYEDDVIEIFPELKESEDERIRKELLQIAKESEDSFYMVMTPNKKERLITWLERQAQKPFGFNNSDTIDHNLNDYCCKIYSALHKENGGVLSFARLQHMAMDIYGWCKEQGEQKSAEWSEDDETNLTNIIIMLKEGASLHFNKKDIAKGVSCLKDLIERVQQKQEWSEEDENRINRLILYFEDKESFTAEDDVEYANWLKNLKERVLSQPKQEWSESDKERIEELVVLIRHSNYTDGVKRKVISWLDSLKDRVQPQSQWKSSDEHIHWLKWATNRMPDTEKANEAEAVLEELLEELKKLTGE